MRKRVVECGSVGQTVDDTIISHIRFACWINKATSWNPLAWSGPLQACNGTALPLSLKTPTQNM